MAGHRRFGTAAAALLWAACGAAVAQSPPAAAPAERGSPNQAQYLLERERCNDPAQYQDRDACLREAAAAREMRARQGEAGTTPSAADLQRNEARRCDPLPDDQRADCLRRVEGAGLDAGSVGGGGILRETRTIEIAPQPPVQPVELK